MKKQYIKSFMLSVVLGSLSLTSCDGYLDTMPSDSLPSDEVIMSLQDVETALNGSYYSLNNESYYGCDFIARGEVGGEDVQCSANTNRTDNFYRFVARQNNSPQGLWKYPYMIINRANSLLEAIDKGNLPAGEELNNAKGEALAIRALCHFDLLKMYGKPYFVENGNTLGVPLVDKVLPASELPARSTVAQGYDMVITDLNNALTIGIQDKVKEGRFNSWAVKGLLTRVHLYKGDYDKAFEYAQDIIKNSPYTLLENKNYVSAWGGRCNSESIFDIEISELQSGVREMFGYVVDPKGYASVINTTEFETLINENGEDDVRTQLIAKGADAQKGHTYMNKYPGINGSTVVNNIRVIRLSDIYLMAAEAALKKTEKDQQSANEYLNAIIKRAMPNAADVEATIDLVLKERRKELVMEGHRFYDILRLGIKVTRKGDHHYLNNTDLIAPSYEDYRAILAIPQTEIDVNPNIKQNEGY